MDHGQCEYCGKVGHLNESPDGFAICDMCADEEIQSWYDTPFVTVQRKLAGQKD